MRKPIFALFPLVLVMLASTTTSITSAADPPPAGARKLAARDDDDDGTPSRARTGRANLADAGRKLKPILKADPRVTQLTNEILEIRKIADKRERKAKLQALSTRVAAVRNDAIKKAGLDPADLEAKATLTRTQMTQVVKVEEPPPPPPPGSVISTVTATAFPLTISYKSECPDGKDKWDFDGSLTRIDAQSTPVDEDCWNIRAGRAATFQVPSGTKKIKVTMKAKVELDAMAMHFGAFAEATGTLGIRVQSPNGTMIGSIPPLMQGYPSIPTPVVIKNTKKIHAINTIPSPLPVDFGAFEDQVQEGDEGASASFAFPGDPGPSLQVGVYVGGWVDADWSGVATLNNNLRIQEIKVTFYR